ncbi:DUF106 domain-containing protein [Candidatus Woesearchaeota archaeon]|nr:DUF106 domain-containing protein [Candidatus Woesearchaeota archaeon]
MVLDSIINPVFAPFLELPVFWSIFILSLVLSVVITFIYKAMTNQELMKSLREDMKKQQKQLKTLRSQPEKMMAIQKQIMEKNGKYMLQSFKPMIITFIPIIMIFGWFNAHYSYDPINPGEEFITTMYFSNIIEGVVSLELPNEISVVDENEQEIKDSVSWKLKGDAGEYIITYNVDGKTYDKDILITDSYGYRDPIKSVNDGVVSSIDIGYEKLKPLSFKIFKWQPGWLGIYIILSLIFSLTLRKSLGIH